MLLGWCRIEGVRVASVGDVAARIAKVTAAFAFGGPAVGSREVVVQSTDVLSKREHTFKKVLADVEKQLLAVSTARGWSADQAHVALTTAADLFEADPLTARELVAIGLDEGPQRTHFWPAARRCWQR